jgi:hypothetical protein
MYLSAVESGELDTAVRYVTGERPDSSKLRDMGRQYDTMESEKSHLDLASVGRRIRQPIATVSEEGFDKSFNFRGHFAHCAEGSSPLREGGSTILNGPVVNVKGFLGAGVCSARRRRCAHSHGRERPNGRTTGPGPHAQPGVDCRHRRLRRIAGPFNQADRI